MDQKMLIVGMSALLVGVVIGWIIGLSSTQNLILNITNNSSNQPVDEASITQPTQENPGNETTPQDDQGQNLPQDGTPSGNTSQRP